jgi:hypothetical protein
MERSSKKKGRPPEPIYTPIDESSQQATKVQQVMLEHDPAALKNAYRELFDRIAVGKLQNDGTRAVSFVLKDSGSSFMGVTVEEKDSVREEVAGATGLEPAASGVTGRRYNQLNYHPARVPKPHVSHLLSFGRRNLTKGAVPVNAVLGVVSACFGCMNPSS